MSFGGDNCQIDIKYPEYNSCPYWAGHECYAAKTFTKKELEAYEQTIKNEVLDKCIKIVKRLGDTDTGYSDPYNVQEAYKDMILDNFESLRKL